MSATVRSRRLAVPALRLEPICQVGNLGGTVASAGVDAVLNGLSQWVASGAEWLLAQIGDVLI